MKNSKRFLETYVFSSIGVIVLALVFIAVNLLAATFYDRIDLTENKMYTLSKGTKEILKSLDTPVTIQLFYSKNVPDMPVYLKNYASRVLDFLKEYKAEAPGKIRIEELNPTPDSDAEDAAHLAGIYGQTTRLGGDKIYLGLAVTCLDKTVAIPFLSTDRENLLEYDITRAIYRVINPKKPVIGLMSSLPVMGGPSPMMMPGQPNRRKPWLLISELKREFEVRKIETSADKIPDDISVMVLIHAKNLSDKTLYALDQFILRGGRMVAFLDPMSFVESRTNPMSRFQHTPPGSSTLGKLLDKWGIQFKTDKVVADMVYMTRVRGRDGQPESLPTILSIPKAALLKNDPATAQLSSLLFAFSGAFEGTPPDYLKKEALVQTSDECEYVEKFMAQMPGNAVLRDFKPLNHKLDLAIRLSGKFKTAFPDGNPADASAGDSKEKKKTNKAKNAALKIAKKPGVVVLVGDSDMLYDNFCVRRTQLFGQEIITPLNDNLSFAQNIIEMLTGDTRLISIRGRGVVHRPFLKVQKMQAEAQRQYQDQIRALEDKLSQTRQKISEIQKTKGKTQRLALSPEQQEAIRKFREQEAKTRKNLKELRKKLRRDIDSLEVRLELFNIALMPLVVSLGGIGLAFAKRRKGRK